MCWLKSSWRLWGRPGVLDPCYIHLEWKFCVAHVSIPTLIGVVLLHLMLSWYTTIKYFQSIFTLSSLSSGRELHRSWQLVWRTLFAKGLNYMSQSVMYMLANCQYDIICQHKWLFKMKNDYNMTFSVAHWDTWDESFCILVCKGQTVLSILLTSVMCLHSSIQEEDILQLTYVRCHLCIL